MVQKLFEIIDLDEMKKFIKDTFREAVKEIESLQQENPDELLTTEEAAKELKKCRQTIQNMRDRGDFKAHYYGNRPMYRRGDLKPYMNKK